MINLKVLKTQIEQLDEIKKTLEQTYSVISSLTGETVVHKQRKKRSDAGKERGPRGKKTEPKSTAKTPKKSEEAK